MKARNATLAYSIQNLGDQQENLRIDISSKSGAKIYARDTAVTLGSRQSYNGIAEIGTTGNQDTFDSVVVSQKEVVSDFINSNLGVGISCLESFHRSLVHLRLFPSR